MYIRFIDWKTLKSYTAHNIRILGAHDDFLCKGIFLSL